jgi:transcriptional regulator with XRE-family HTH domain
MFGTGLKKAYHDSATKQNEENVTKGGNEMSIGDFIRQYRKEKNITQGELAAQLNFERSMMSKVESGARKWPESSDAKLASINWRFTLWLADERTGGFISNLLKLVPNFDLHPSALKELLLKELKEGIQALGEIIFVRHICQKKRKEAAEKVWFELKDVVDKGVIMMGVLEEEFGLDREALIKKHEHQVRQGER